MKNIKDQYLKYFVVGIFFLLLLVAYQLYSQNNQKADTPKTELDCLKLGSNERAAACIKLLRPSPKPQEDFPIFNLSVENPAAHYKDPYPQVEGDIGECIEVSGTITNSSSLEAQYLALKIDFLKTKNGTPFHYEVFAPFESAVERVQPGSSKTFTKCLRRQSFDAVKDIQNWFFTITPFSAKIYQE